MAENTRREIREETLRKGSRAKTIGNGRKTMKKEMEERRFERELEAKLQSEMLAIHEVNLATSANNNQATLLASYLNRKH